MGGSEAAGEPPTPEDLCQQPAGHCPGLCAREVCGPAAPPGAGPGKARVPSAPGGQSITNRLTPGLLEAAAGGL